MWNNFVSRIRASEFINSTYYGSQKWVYFKAIKYIIEKTTFKNPVLSTMRKRIVSKIFDFL